MLGKIIRVINTPLKVVDEVLLGGDDGESFFSTPLDMLAEKVDEAMTDDND